MWRSRTVAVVVPAFDEARLIQRTLRRMPQFVDFIYVVDDASRDATARRAASLGDPRVQVVRHRTNRGVGAAIGTGYCRALDDGVDLIAVMAGDDQMHPDDLAPLLDAVIESEADYGKGNRFIHASCQRMPRMRRAGGALLSWATRRATGYAISDSQCGYTVIAKGAAQQLPLDALWPRYGYPNDLLALLSEHGCRVVEIPVRPVYADERSGIRPWHFFTVLAVLLRRKTRDTLPRRGRSAASRRSSDPCSTG